MENIGGQNWDLYPFIEHDNNSWSCGLLLRFFHRSRANNLGSSTQYFNLFNIDARELRFCRSRDHAVITYHLNFQPDPRLLASFEHCQKSHPLGLRLGINVFTLFWGIRNMTDFSRRRSRVAIWVPPLKWAASGDHFGTTFVRSQWELAKLTLVAFTNWNMAVKTCSWSRNCEFVGTKLILRPRVFRFCHFRSRGVDIKRVIRLLESTPD